MDDSPYPSRLESEIARLQALLDGRHLSPPAALAFREYLSLAQARLETARGTPTNG